MCIRDRYVSYKKHLIDALQQKGRSIVASGHEHALQYIERHDQYFIVSGAGSKNNKVATGKGSKFAVGQKGYVKLVCVNPKKAIAQFVVPGQFEEYDNVAYENVLELN